MSRKDAERLLQTALNDPRAAFRDGQWEAIDLLVTERKKLLVVQRTGWGKSSVYFIATRLMRDRGYGPTIIISPLLALMRNQVESAARLGIRALTMNSSNSNQARQHTQSVLNNQVDCLLISPERLANEDFVRTVLQPIANNIGLLVVDEAHCISDWGHDFRPDYRRLLSVLRQLPPNMPVLATTATANNRVINDVVAQLGDIEVIRGTLVRESLALQNITLADQPSRLAWLAATIPQIEGAGIVYVLTKRDALQVRNWLISKGIDAQAYFSDVTHPDFPDTNAYREHLEDQLLSNRLKVLVATSALGMGYDKPDLTFVIHYQAPGSIVSYYQQVGRAGRGIDKSFGVLLSGKEDERIQDFFRRAAFPSEHQVSVVLDVLAKVEGLKARDLEEHLNLRKGIIDQVLKFLSVENPSPIIKNGANWFRTPVPYSMDHEQIARLTAQREVEWQELVGYVQAGACLMEYLRRALDDPDAEPCGRCANCRGQAIFSPAVDRQLAVEAARFLRHADIPIQPKKQVAANAFPKYRFSGNFPPELLAAEGRILSKWADGGWGGVVEEGKHTGHFADELVDAMIEMISQRWRPAPFPEWVCCVPSLNNPRLVDDFARRLAAKLGLPFVSAISKVFANQPQKFQNNRYYQCSNLDGVFNVSPGIPAGSVLLVDDVVDSGWTMTVLAALLRRNGCGTVYPVALASSTTSD